MKVADATTTLESVVQPSLTHLTRNLWTSQATIKDILWTSQATIKDIRDLSSDKPLVVGPMRVSVLTCARWQFVLKRPIPVQLSYEQDTWIQRYEPLDILAYGRSREEASEAFCEDFACCWEEIASEVDGNLTVDAQELKNRLHSIVKDAQQIE